MAQLGKGLAAKTQNLGSVLRTNMVEGDSFSLCHWRKEPIQAKLDYDKGRFVRKLLSGEFTGQED